MIAKKVKNQFVALEILKLKETRVLSENTKRNRVAENQDRPASPVRPASPAPPPKPETSLVFMLITSEREYTFSAKNYKDKNQWVDAIKKVQQALSDKDSEKNQLGTSSFFSSSLFILLLLMQLL